MAGFFEFSMMRVRQDVDQKALAELAAFLSRHNQRNPELFESPAAD
jgi:hypothetical protein